MKFIVNSDAYVDGLETRSKAVRNSELETGTLFYSSTHNVQWEIID